MRCFWYAVAALVLATLSADAQTGRQPNTLPGCQYNATPPTLSDKQLVPWQCDVNGKLITNGTASTIVVGTTAISGGVDTRVLFQDGTTLGESAGLTFAKGNEGTTSQLTIGTNARLFGEAANALALRNGTSAQSFRVANTASVDCVTGNFECGVFDWQTSANVLTIGTTKLGSGQTRNWRLVAGGSSVLDFGVTNSNYININTTSGLFVTTGDIRINTGGSLFWNVRTLLSSPVDGNLLLQNNGATSFNSLQLGGTSSSFAAVNVNTAIGFTKVQIRLADDSGFADTFVRRSQNASTTFNSLPTCNQTNAGMRAYITDASATPAYLANVTAGGGGIKVVVTCDSAGWRAMG